MRLALVDAREQTDSATSDRRHPAGERAEGPTLRHTPAICAKERFPVHLGEPADLLLY
jgi:hypothetical protein